jgi:hypothetical protein
MPQRDFRRRLEKMETMTQRFAEATRTDAHSIDDAIERGTASPRQFDVIYQRDTRLLFSLRNAVVMTAIGHRDLHYILHEHEIGSTAVRIVATHPNAEVDPQLRDRLTTAATTRPTPYVNPSDWPGTVEGINKHRWEQWLLANFLVRLLADLEDRLRAFVSAEPPITEFWDVRDVLIRAVHQNLGLTAPEPGEERTEADRTGLGDVFDRDVTKYPAYYRYLGTIVPSESLFLAAAGLPGYQHALMFSNWNEKNDR